MAAVTRTLSRLLCALAAAAALPAAAQAPEQSPYAPSAPTGSTIGSGPSYTAPFRPRFYMGMGYDIGGPKLIEATLSDGSHPSIRSNGGLFLEAGGDFLPIAGGLLHTRATIGLKFKMINASDGDITYMAFPLDVVEFLNFYPLRLGAGITLQLGPKISGSGVASAIDVPLENSLGLAIQAEYEFGGGGRGSGFVIGPRYLVQKLRPKAGGDAVSANTLGFYLAYLP